MIRSFRGPGTEDIFNGRGTKAARRACPEDLWRVARRKLEQLDSTPRLDDLRVPPGNRLEALAGNRTGQQSIRINDQYRVCFAWTADGPESVEIVDYH
jgi:proteic killer suppression protein